MSTDKKIDAYVDAVKAHRVHVGVDFLVSAAHGFAS